MPKIYANLFHSIIEPSLLPVPLSNVCFHIEKRLSLMALTSGKKKIWYFAKSDFNLTLAFSKDMPQHKKSWFGCNKTVRVKEFEALLARNRQLVPSQWNWKESALKHWAIKSQSEEILAFADIKFHIYIYFYGTSCIVIEGREARGKCKTDKT